MQARALHRCIHVLDLPTSIAFYEQALGLHVLHRTGPDDGSWENVFLGNETSGFQLELTWNKGRVEPYNNGDRDTHMAYAVRDAEKVRQIHEEMGCICFDNKKMNLYFIEDPDGCWIEILPEGRSNNNAQTGVDVLYAMHNRRSVRKYTGEPISEQALESVIEAGLLSESGRGLRPWELIVVRDRATLEALSTCRIMGSAMLAEADCAIVVVADPAIADTWIEDCSIVMANMHLAADAHGLGSCWIQGRMREAEEGVTTRDYVASLLGIPDNYELEAILSLGMPENHGAPHVIDEQLTTKVHKERF